MSGKLCSGILYGYIPLDKSWYFMNGQRFFKKNGFKPNLTGRDSGLLEPLQICCRRGPADVNPQRHRRVLALEQKNFLPFLRIRGADLLNPPRRRIKAHFRNFVQIFKKYIAFAQETAQDCIDEAGKALRALICANSIHGFAYKCEFVVALRNEKRERCFENVLYWRRRGIIEKFS